VSTYTDETNYDLFRLKDLEIRAKPGNLALIVKLVGGLSVKTDSHLEFPCEFHEGIHGTLVKDMNVNPCSNQP
jgi:hypothetical protein